MKIIRSDREKLVIIDFPYLWGGFLFLMSLGWLAYILVTKDQVSTSDLIAELAVLVLLFLAGANLTKRCLCEFDLAQRRLAWSRVSLFGQKKVPSLSMT